MKKHYLLLFCSLFYATILNAQIVDSGTTGQCTWTLTGTESDLTLTISGAGVMEDYDSYGDVIPPWRNYDSNSIRTVIIDNGVTHIGANVFYACRAFSSVDFPGSVLTIGSAAFLSCSALTTITIPNSITEIDKEAFVLTGLTSVTIPASVTFLAEDAFRVCSDLTSINVADDNNHYSSIDGILFSKDKKTLIQYPIKRSESSYTIPAGVTVIGNHAFFYCDKLSVVSIPDGVTTIANNAFTYCIGLTSVTIPSGVTEIGDNAFWNCTNFASVTCLSPEPPAISNSVFYNVNIAACVLYVPADQLSLYQNAAVWKDFGNILPFEDEITEIEITLDKEEIYLLAGATTMLTATVTDGVIVTWKSSQPEVATVDAAGTVTAINAGVSLITASVGLDNVVCTLTVIQPGTSTIEGVIANTGTENVRVNLYIKVNDSSQTKRGIVGGYVLLATTVPNGNGEYRFEDLPEGSYQVEVVMEDYDPEATDEITLSDEETFSDINFMLDPEKGIIFVDTGIPTGMEDNFVPDLKVYPNPFTDVLHIMCAVAVETWHAASLQVINTAGAVVHNQTTTHPDETIHLGHLPAGMYIIRFENGNMIKTVKIIKK